jgi:hypothetical protein
MVLTNKKNLIGVGVIGLLLVFGIVGLYSGFMGREGSLEGFDRKFEQAFFGGGVEGVVGLLGGSYAEIITKVEGREVGVIVRDSIATSVNFGSPENSRPGRFADLKEGMEVVVRYQEEGEFEYLVYINE